MDSEDDDDFQPARTQPVKRQKCRLVTDEPQSSENRQHKTQRLAASQDRGTSHQEPANLAQLPRKRTCLQPASARPGQLASTTTAQTLATHHHPCRTPSTNTSSGAQSRTASKVPVTATRCYPTWAAAKAALAGKENQPVSPCCLSRNQVSRQAQAPKSDFPQADPRLRLSHPQPPTALPQPARSAQLQPQQTSQEQQSAAERHTSANLLPSSAEDRGEQDHRLGQANSHSKVSSCSRMDTPDTATSDQQQGERGADSTGAEEVLFSSQWVGNLHPACTEAAQAQAAATAQPDEVLFCSQWVGTMCDGTQQQQQPGTEQGLSQLCSEFGAAPAEAFCPVCGCFLVDVAATETGRSAHVNSCLDQQQHQVSGQHAGHGGSGSSDLFGNFVHLDSEDEDEVHAERLSDGDLSDEEAVSGDSARLSKLSEDPEDAVIVCEVPASRGDPATLETVHGSSELHEPQQQVSSRQSSCQDSQADKPAVHITTWLTSLGLQSCIAAFEKAQIDVGMVRLLSEADLRQLGISALGHRKRILAKVEAEAASAAATVAAAADAALKAQRAAAEAADAAAAAELAARLDAEVAGAGQRPGTGSAGQSESAQPQAPEKAQLPAEAIQAVNLSGETAVSGAENLQQTRSAGHLAVPGSATLTLQQEAAQASHLAGITMPQQQQQRKAKAGAHITDFFASAAPRGASVAGQAGAGNAPQPAAARQMRRAKTSGKPQSSATGRFGHSAAGPAGPPGWLPEWQMVPGTNFVVDKFGRKTQDSIKCKSWFLTHFHSDHYQGLNSRYKAGLVFCTPITARLVQQRLKTPADRIRIVPLNTPLMVEGVRVTFLEANHCPGAAMILFEPPGAVPVLHTGDCRCHTSMQLEPCLQPLRGKLNLILDTTYCQPQYDFPLQQQVLQFVLEAVKAEAFNPGTLFLFGSYTIGKERLFLEVARLLQQKVYVSPTKKAVLDCLGLAPEYASLLTTNDSEARIQAVPLWMVSLKQMARIAKHYKGRFSTIVGFQPTGWTQKSGVQDTERGRASHGRRRQKGTLIVYQVPYSEHSSFRELREFVAWLQPRRIIPSVGNDSGPKARDMVAALRPA